MTVCLKDDCILIGKDFGDAMIRAARSTGEIHILGRTIRTYRWRSTLNCTESESILRQTVKDEGLDVVYFKSQAC